MRAPIVLSAPVWDALKAGAKAHGGIGFGRFELPDADATPLCAWGMLQVVGTPPTDGEGEEMFTTEDNDDVVIQILHEDFALTDLPESVFLVWATHRRISFDRWAKGMNATRGEG